MTEVETIEENTATNKDEYKPTPEQFGYEAKDHPEEQGGWTLEGGEEAYNKALAEWESKTVEEIEEKIIDDLFDGLGQDAKDKEEAAKPEPTSFEL